MTTTKSTPPQQPKAPLRALSGLVSAGAAIGVGHLVAALTDPSASPLIAVGSVAIDAAPTPVKEFVVRELGNNDKPVLLSAISLVLVVVSLALGLIAWRHRRIALVGIGGLGVVGAGAAAYRLGFGAVGPSLVSAVVGVAAMLWLTRSPKTATDRPASSTYLSRRALLIGSSVVAAAGLVSGGAGVLVERAGRGARRLMRLPRPSRQRRRSRPGPRSRA